jgi:hypothetical protein
MISANVIKLPFASHPLIARRNSHKAEIVSPEREIRVLSLGASFVFLADFGLYIAHLALDRFPPPYFVGLMLLFAPLAISAASIVRLLYLHFRGGFSVPFVDGWLIHISIVGVLVGPVVLIPLIDLIFAIWAR